MPRNVQVQYVLPWVIISIGVLLMIIINLIGNISQDDSKQTLESIAIEKCKNDDFYNANFERCERMDVRPWSP